MKDDDWPFDQSRNTATLMLRSVMSGGLPVLLVVHDLEDCGAGSRRIVVHLKGQSSFVRESL